MAAHVARIPPMRRRRWPARVLGLLATAALLGSGVAIALMVMPSEEEAAAPSATPAAKTERKPELTKGQRAARRAAIQTLREEGYEPVRLSDWRPRSRPRVLVGRDETGAMRAFFFMGREFVGYDDPSTSERVRVVKTGSEGVTLAYRLNTGDSERVRFRWEDDAVVPDGPVPPVTLR